MMIVGCDLHTRYQQIAMVDTETSELVQRRLEYESGEAGVFYAGLKGAVRVGIEATGHTQWFEAMLSESGQELWMSLHNLSNVLGLMLRLKLSAIADSVAFMMAANGGYDVKNTRPEPARGPAGLLGSEQHYLA